MEWPVRYERKIRFSDSDAQGIVFNGNYLTYFDDTVTDLFDVLGFGWEGFTEHGVDMVLARSEIDFRSSARIGETIATTARVTRIGSTSVHLVLECREVTTDRLVVEGTLVQVVVDTETFRPRPVPQFFVDAVERVQNAPVPRS